LKIEDCLCQWTQQNLPVSGQIDDLAFLNKDTGFIAMGSSNILLRTLNGGTNWDIITNFRIYQLEKIDTKTLYAINYDGNKLYRTYDGGTSWDSITAGGWCGISFINKDTGWASSWTGIYKTTNAGMSYNFLSSTANCGKIVFLKENYSGEYCGFLISSGALFKTINSGLNWINVPNPLGAGNYYSIYFLNKDTGWSYFHYNITLTSDIIFTSNGGANWIRQYVDSNNNSVLEFYFANNMKGWGCGGDYHKIYATTNGGVNWGSQYIPITYAYQIYFLDSLTGWCGNYSSSNIIAKTTNGGGAITYIGVDSNNSRIPVSYKLNQNYPNPFNARSKIKYQISKSSDIKIKIFDIVGREIITLVNRKQNSGEYEVIFDGSYLSSGIYFYSIYIDEIRKDTKTMVLLK